MLHPSLFSPMLEQYERNNLSTSVITTIIHHFNGVWQKKWFCIHPRRKWKECPVVRGLWIINVTTRDQSYKNKTIFNVINIILRTFNQTKENFLIKQHENNTIDCNPYLKRPVLHAHFLETATHVVPFCLPTVSLGLIYLHILLYSLELLFSVSPLPSGIKDEKNILMFKNIICNNYKH